MALRRLLKRSLIATGLVGASLSFLALGLEAAFRIVPGLLPAGNYGSRRASPELGVSLYAGPVFYSGSRFVRREVNALGFLDVEHSRKRKPGHRAIGFFGDSYVESLQVPLEQTFFRLLADRLRDVEPFAFGHSGWGTLQGARVYEEYGEAFGLDVVVYVFVENDPGDNTLSIKGPTVSGSLALGVLSDSPPGYAVQWTRPLPSDRHATLRSVATDSLLGKVVRQRLAALSARGIRVRAAKEDREMSAPAAPSRASPPDPNSLPSGWPEAYREEARELTERILRAWQAQVLKNRRRFAILYVPRGEDQLRGDLKTSDTWLPWLQTFTRAEGIPLLDLSPILKAESTPAQPVYEDHWTPHGHRVVADALAKWLPDLLSPSVAAPAPSPSVP